MEIFFFGISIYRIGMFQKIFYYKYEKVLLP
jgi:hypothetical protein